MTTPFRLQVCYSRLGVYDNLHCYSTHFSVSAFGCRKPRLRFSHLWFRLLTSPRATLLNEISPRRRWRRRLFIIRYYFYLFCVVNWRVDMKSLWNPRRKEISLAIDKYGVVELSPSEINVVVPWQNLKNY
ncbi:unnamed protein product [Lactuca virosa]|uniref:Uncharacterized protein n=1 Tax=Lactuca virosa TaxID=75947 RepID=A0AAU9NPV9_9ASTR|nr:unnamed protein product [Lactuca virosa]